MAIRVKKLAKELRQSPGQVLGLLHELGFPRYKSPEDMVADPAAELARKAVRRGVRAAPVLVATPAKAKRSRPASGAAADDLMARLVPGVVPQKRERDATPAPRGRPAPVRPEVAPVPASAPEPASPPPTPDTAALDALRRELEQQRTELEDLRAALAAERSALSVERDRLDEERLASESARAEVSEDSLSAVLHARGLRGTDEAERALAALANHHQLGPILGDLRVGDPAGLLRRLRRHLILVGGEIPGALDAPAVTVSPDRAELPGDSELSKLVARLGEQLLLNGLRRVLVAGVPPRWHGLLQSTDPRIELRLEPAHERGADAAARDVATADAVLGWSLPVRDDAQRVYKESSLRVVLVERGPFAQWLAAVIDALAS